MLVDAEPGESPHDALGRTDEGELPAVRVHVGGELEEPVDGGRVDRLDPAQVHHEAARDELVEIGHDAPQPDEAGGVERPDEHEEGGRLARDELDVDGLGQGSRRRLGSGHDGPGGKAPPSLITSPRAGGTWVGAVGSPPPARSGRAHER